MLHYYNNPELADVELHLMEINDNNDVESKEQQLPLIHNTEIIYAHRVVLAAHSLYFRTMFQSKFEEGRLIVGQTRLQVPVPVANRLHFKQVIRFCYTQELMENSDTLTILSILSLAEIYQVTELWSSGLSYLCTHFSVDNAGSILEMLLKFPNLNEFIELCMNRLRLLAPSFIKSKQWLLLPQSVIHYIARDIYFPVHEEVAFEACMNWSNRNNSTNSNKNGQIYPTERLSLLSYEHLFTRVAKCNIMSDSQLFQIAQDKASSICRSVEPRLLKQIFQPNHDSVSNNNNNNNSTSTTHGLDFHGGLIEFLGTLGYTQSFSNPQGRQGRLNPIRTILLSAEPTIDDARTVTDLAEWSSNNTKRKANNNNNNTTEGVEHIQSLYCLLEKGLSLDPTHLFTSNPLDQVVVEATSDQNNELDDDLVTTDKLRQWAADSKWTSLYTSPEDDTSSALKQIELHNNDDESNRGFRLLRIRHKDGHNNNQSQLFPPSFRFEWYGTGYFQPTSRFMIRLSSKISSSLSEPV